MFFKITKICIIYSDSPHHGHQKRGRSHVNLTRCLLAISILTIVLVIFKPIIGENDSSNSHDLYHFFDVHDEGYPNI